MQRHHARSHSSKKQRVAASNSVESGFDHSINNVGLAPSDDIDFTTNSTDDDPPFPADMDITSPTDTTDTSVKESPNIISFNQFENTKCRKYFQHNHNDLGSAYLVGMSQFRRESVTPLLDMFDVETQMYIAFFVGTLTQSQMHHFASILDRVIMLTKRSKAREVSEPTSDKTDVNIVECDIPTTLAEIRSYVTEGKFAIFDNLPHPLIHVLGNHSCISAKDCVSDILGHGFPIPPIQQCTLFDKNVQVTSLLNCRRAIHFQQSITPIPDPDNEIFVNFIFWGDDFEPNYSIKANRQSVHISTLSIVQPVQNKESIFYTFPVSVGPKGADHSSVTRHLVDSIKLFMNEEPMVMYSREKKGMVRVRANIIACLQDQPERRETLYLSRGNSTYHGRFGYSMDTKQVRRELIPCQECYASLRDEALNIDSEHKWRLGNCAQCSCWATNIDHPLLRTHPPEDYPQDQLQTVDQKIPSIRLSFRILREAVTLVHNKIVSGVWTSTNAKVYLKTFCIQSTVIEVIVQYATNCYLMKEIKKQPDYESTPQYIALSQEQLRNPKSFLAWEIPVLWDDRFPIELYMEVPMHLLFLGMGKNMTLDIRKWTLCRNKNTSFIEYATGLLETIETLKLPWLKLLPYSNRKFGGWVAENFVAMVRLFKWFYQPLPTISTEAPWEQPDSPVEEWLVKDLSNWLIKRGLPANGLKAELFARVSDSMNSADGVPEIVAPTGGTVEQLMMTINRLYDLIALVMQPSISEEGICTAEVYVRLFLTEYSKLDDHLYSTKEKASWHSKYNFLSLIRCVEQMRDIGPLRNIWEGSFSGEGYIQFVKPLITAGLRAKWDFSLMNNILRERCLSLLTYEYTKANKQTLLDYKVYTSVAQVEGEWLCRKPISFAITSDNKKIIAYKDGGQIMGREVKIIHFHAIHNEMSYFIFKLSTEIVSFEKNCDLRGGLLLPLLDSNGKPKKQCNVYTCIDSEWNYLGDESGNWVLSNPGLVPF
jgi:hypothetical protein